LVSGLEKFGSRATIANHVRAAAPPIPPRRERDAVRGYDGWTGVNQFGDGTADAIWTVVPSSDRPADKGDPGYVTKVFGTTPDCAPVPADQQLCELLEADTIDSDDVSGITDIVTTFDNEVVFEHFNPKYKQQAERDGRHGEEVRGHDFGRHDW
jgi:hypothetical protein